MRRIAALVAGTLITLLCANGGSAQAPAPVQAPVGPPTGPYATPQEAAYIQERMGNPVGSQAWQEGVLKAREIQLRRMTPLPYPCGMIWDYATARFVPMPGVSPAEVCGGR